MFSIVQGVVCSGYMSQGKVATRPAWRDDVSRTKREGSTEQYLPATSFWVWRERGSANRYREVILVTINHMSCNSLSSMGMVQSWQSLCARDHIAVDTERLEKLSYRACRTTPRWGVIDLCHTQGWRPI